MRRKKIEKMFVRNPVTEEIRLRLNITRVKSTVPETKDKTHIEDKYLRDLRTHSSRSRF